MTQFNISITRRTVATASITVDGATSIQEAEKLALQQAGDHDFRTHESEFELTNGPTIDASVPDAELTADQLTARYAKPDGGWGEHPEYARTVWGHEVSEGDCSQSYWDWVVSQIEQADKSEEAEPPHSPPFGEPHGQ